MRSRNQWATGKQKQRRTRLQACTSGCRLALNAVCCVAPRDHAAAGRLSQDAYLYLSFQSDVAWAVTAAAIAVLVLLPVHAAVRQPGNAVVSPVVPGGNQSHRFESLSGWTGGDWIGEANGETHPFAAVSNGNILAGTNPPSQSIAMHAISDAGNPTLLLMQKQGKNRANLLINSNLLRATLPRTLPRLLLDWFSHQVQSGRRSLCSVSRPTLQRGCLLARTCFGSTSPVALQLQLVCGELLQTLQYGLLFMKTAGRKSRLLVCSPNSSVGLLC